MDDTRIYCEIFRSLLISKAYWLSVAAFANTQSECL